MGVRFGDTSGALTYLLKQNLKKVTRFRKIFFVSQLFSHRTRGGHRWSPFRAQERTVALTQAINSPQNFTSI
jgi:hypothetical protein